MTKLKNIGRVGCQKAGAARQALLLGVQGAYMARWLFRPATWLRARKHYSTYKLVWKSMNSNRKICIIVHRTITERVALLYNRTLLFRAQGLNRGQNGDFGLLHSSWAWEHYSTYILVWKSMKSNREICIIAHRAIIERIALLYSRIMLFADGDLARYIACGYRDITLHIN